MPHLRPSASTLLLVMLALVVAMTGCGSEASEGSAGTSFPPSLSPPESPPDSRPVWTTAPRPATEASAWPATITVTVLYDNTSAVSGTRADWGFSCLVQGYEKTVIFDTGARPQVLLHNMRCLKVDPHEIDTVVLSHEHSDHTGGLPAVVGDHQPAVYYPATFSQKTLAPARAANSTMVPVDADASPCPGVTVLAPLGRPPESGLLLETSAGPVLVVGCAHPGVLIMAQAAAQSAGKPPVAVLGGFHLGSQSERQVAELAKQLQALGVKRCGPAHCTGARAIAQLALAFGEGLIPLGVGAVVEF